MSDVVSKSPDETALPAEFTKLPFPSTMNDPRVAQPLPWASVSNLHTLATLAVVASYGVLNLTKPNASAVPGVVHVIPPISPKMPPFIAVSVTKSVDADGSVLSAGKEVVTHYAEVVEVRRAMASATIERKDFIRF